MRKLFLLYIFINCIICTTCIAQFGWYQLNSGTNQNLFDIQFINDNTGFVVGATGIILKSTNSGLNWIALNSFTTNGLRSIYFTDSNTGYAVGEEASILKTTNSGTNWLIIPNPLSTTPFYGVHFINSMTGFISGGLNSISLKGTVLITTNAGGNWIDRSFGSDVTFFDVHFFNGSTGLVCGPDPTDRLIKTTNSGINWLLTSGGSSYVKFGMSFYDLSGGFSVGGAILRTTDSGDNWIVQLIRPLSSPLRGVHTVDANYCYTAGDSGAVFKTSNGGTNWISQNSTTINRLNGIWFINQNTGWTCGNSGTILKTTNGGVTAIQPISNEIPDEYKLYQNYPNPFNPISKIKFEIAKLSYTKLTVFDILGQGITTLVNEELNPGIYEVEWNATGFPSGVYLYKLSINQYTELKRMVLIK